MQDRIREFAVSAALKRGWLVFLITAITVLVGVFGYLQTRPSVYTSTAVVALTPKGERPVTAQVVLLTAPRYVAYATSPFVLRQVAGPLDLDAADLQNGVVVTMAAATANLTISVTLRDAEDARRVADAIAKEVLRKASGDPILAATSLAQAIRPSEPSGPPRGAIMTSGTVAAIVLGIGAAVLVERHMRRRAEKVARGVASVRVGTPSGRLT